MSFVGLSLLLVLVAVAPCTPEYWGNGEDSVNHLQPHDLQEAYSTTPNPGPREALNSTLSPEDSFELNKIRAIELVLRKVLRALGPEFEAQLPSAPTNATLTPLNSSLRVETGTCPERYRRCSSQTFYPSCEVPRNTDRQLWQQRFALYFNIWSEISPTIRRNDVLNATLRLYKLSLPIDTKTFIVTLHRFTHSLKRNRERSIAVASTSLSSDYEGWVFMNVSAAVPRLRSRSNHGFKIGIQDENNVPWNIPNFFVRMDCKASNESLIPLPFEVQLDDNTQRYPALNIRSGTQEVETDNNDYLQAYGNVISYDSASSRSQYPPLPQRHRSQTDYMDTHYRHGIGHSFNSRHINEIQRLQNRGLDQLLSPHLFGAENSPVVGANDDAYNANNNNNNVARGSSDYDVVGQRETEESYHSDSGVNYRYQDTWRSGETGRDHTNQDANRDPQIRYKKQAPHFLSNQQEVDQQYYLQADHQHDGHYHYDDGAYDLYDEIPHGDTEVKPDIVEAEEVDSNSTSSSNNTSSSDSNLINSLALRREDDYRSELINHTREQAPQLPEEQQAFDSVEANRSALLTESNQQAPYYFNHPYRRTNRHHRTSHGRRHHTRHHRNHHRPRRPHYLGSLSPRREMLTEDNIPQPSQSGTVDISVTPLPQ